MVTRRPLRGSSSTSVASRGRDGQPAGLVSLELLLTLAALVPVAILFLMILWQVLTDMQAQVNAIVGGPLL
jgi:hypothetical protein